MGLLAGINIKTGLPSISYNTDCRYDLQTGTPMKGIDGKWYIDGGVNRGLNGIIGPGNSYKSSVMDSFVCRMLTLYPESECLLVDTEDSATRDESRLPKLSGERPLDTLNRIRVMSGGVNTLQDAYAAIVETCMSKDGL